MDRRKRANQLKLYFWLYSRASLLPTELELLLLLLLTMLLSCSFMRWLEAASANLGHFVGQFVTSLELGGFCLAKVDQKPGQPVDL